MRDIRNAPLFLRLGARLRGPKDITVGTLKCVIIRDLTCYGPTNEMPMIITPLDCSRSVPSAPSSMKVYPAIMRLSERLRRVSASRLPTISVAAPASANVGPAAHWPALRKARPPVRDKSQGC